MASSPQWTWVWVNSGSWWWTGRPGMLWFIGSQGVGHTEQLNWTELKSAYKLNKQGDNIQPWHTPFLIWNQSVVTCPVLTFDSWLVYNSSIGRLGGLVFPCLEEVSTVYSDPHTPSLWHSQKAEVDILLELCRFLMIQQMLTIWSLVPLPFLKLAWTSGISWFMYCWSLVWRILSITCLACEMSSVAQ